MRIPFKNIFRHLWHQRLFTLLNVVGLAIGISACWIIYGIASYEYSFDSRLPDKEHTYRLVTGFIFDEKESYNGGVSAPLYPEIRKQVTGVERVVPVFGRWINSVLVPAENNKPPFLVEDPQDIVATDTNYFTMVPYRWLAGNKSAAFDAPENVVLTESRARQYFGNGSPADMIGKTLTYSDTIVKKVSGIVKDLDYPTEFIAKEFFTLEPKVYELNEWTNTNGSDKVYFQTSKNADTSKILAQITDIVEAKVKAFHEQRKPGWKFTRWYELMSLPDSHFSTHINEQNNHKASKPVLLGLIGLGGFLLLLACINYINLATAQIPQRRKEIGVRKTLGSGRGQLMSQVFFETFVTVVIAAIFSLLFTWLGFRLLTDIVPEGSGEYAKRPGVFGVLLMLVLTVTAISGLYPAWLIAKVQPITIIRGVTAFNGISKGLSPRKVLIVLQFVIAQVFIVCAMIMGTQLSYTLKKDMGFDRDAVLLVDVSWKLLHKKGNETKHFALASELSRNPGIGLLSLGRPPMTNNYSSSQYQYVRSEHEVPVSRQVFRKEVDTNYLNLYNIKLLAGRNLTGSDTTNEFVINETAVKAFGFRSPHDALGKMIGQTGFMHPVVGVVQDFHLQDFHTTIDPVALMSNKRNTSTFNIKLKGRDTKQWQTTIRAIENEWYRFYPPGTFSYKFYDETLEAMYKDERNTSTLINLATIVSIIISCLGLFGLATLTAFQRNKEIGIRKILGASMTGSIRMLSADFVRLIIIALLIASPVAWWGMNKWLEDFAYRIDIQLWFFALAGIAAIFIALLTVSYQSVRAALANPVSALRTE